MTQLNFRFKFITAAALCSLLFSTMFFACKKDDDPADIVDQACLTNNIAIAQALYDGSVEGTKPGEYVVGSRTDLKTILDAAIVVSNTSTATQADITNACDQLQAGINAFSASLIHEIAEENLIGFWKMNGNANDSSGKGNNGVLTIGHFYFGAGSVTPTLDRFGRPDMAYHFDHGGNIEVPYTSTLNPQEMTLSIWCKKDTAGRTINADTYTLMSLNRWNGYKYQLQSANKFFYTVHAINGADTVYYDKDDETAVLDNGVWYHGVVTYKSGEMNFYVNGDLVKSWTDVPGTPITVPSTINFVIGQDLPTSYYLTSDLTGNQLVDYGGFWTGDLDDAMFYNTALDATQVKSIFDNQNTL
ncbi:MAG: LamG domain-containing protein [Chitinophagales bacterium]|nr:LamG domain-containing protein [Chitinophagales bacterium]